MEFFGIEPWIIWSALGLLFLISEIFVPGFWLATLGIGAFTASFVSVMAENLNIQLIAFASGTGFAFIVVRPLALRYLYKRNHRVRTNVNALEGKSVIVLKTVDPANQTGKVKMGGEVWKATTEDGSVIREGVNATVVRVDGATLIVKKKED